MGLFISIASFSTVVHANDTGTIDTTIFQAQQNGQQVTQAEKSTLIGTLEAAEEKKWRSRSKKGDETACDFKTIKETQLSVEQAKYNTKGVKLQDESDIKYTDIIFSQKQQNSKQVTPAEKQNMPDAMETGKEKTRRSHKEKWRASEAVGDFNKLSRRAQLSIERAKGNIKVAKRQDESDVKITDIAFTQVQKNSKPITPAEKQAIVDMVGTAERKARRFYGKTEDITKTAEAFQKQHIMKAQQIVERAKSNMERVKFQDEDGVKLADNKGVNLKRLLGKYYHKYQESKVEHELVPELMVFVSFSMPEASLKELGEQVAKLGGVLVLRGMYNNSLTATFKKMQSLSEKGVPTIIHPGLFKKFNIKTVPAIALVDKENSYCLKTESMCTPVADLTTGNVTLFYALNQFEAGGDYRARAKAYLLKAGGKA